MQQGRSDQHTTQSGWSNDTWQNSRRRRGKNYGYFLQDNTWSNSGGTTPDLQNSLLQRCHQWQTQSGHGRDSRGEAEPNTTGLTGPTNLQDIHAPLVNTGPGALRIQVGLRHAQQINNQIDPASGPARRLRQPPHTKWGETRTWRRTHNLQQSRGRQSSPPSGTRQHQPETLQDCIKRAAMMSIKQVQREELGTLPTFAILARASSGPPAVGIAATEVGNTYSPLAPLGSGTKGRDNERLSFSSVSGASVGSG